MPQSYKVAALFGGAITAEIPASYADVSTLRQVPDNQEVFVQDDGFESIMFDILERVDRDKAKTDEEALKFHLEDVVGSEETKIWGTEKVVLGSLPKPPAYTLFATTKPGPGSKWKGPAVDFTGILLILIRLVSVDTDIVVSINVPHIRGQYSKEDVNLEEQKEGPQLAEARELRDRVIQSFDVRDWGLFGVEEEGIK